MYLPQHDRMLQIIINEDNRHDLHIIHVPRNGTIRDAIGGYLRDVVKIEPEGVKVCYFSKDPRKYSRWDDLAGTPIKYFDSNEKIMIREALDSMNMAVIDDRTEDIGASDALPTFGENCPLLKDIDVGSDVAMVGDQ